MPKDCFKPPVVRAVLFRLLIPLQLMLICLPAQADYWGGLAVSPIYSNSASGFSSNEEGAQTICDDVWEGSITHRRGYGWWLEREPDRDQPPFYYWFCGSYYWCGPPWDRADCPVSNYHRMIRMRLYCTDGRQFDRNTGECYCPAGKSCNVSCPSGQIASDDGVCEAASNHGQPQCPIGKADPIHIGTGNMFRSETDYAGTSSKTLRFRRYYNSMTYSGLGGRVGKGWRHSYQYELVGPLSYPWDKVYSLIRPDGRSLQWREFRSEMVSSTDQTGELNRTADGWQYTDGNGSQEFYDAGGKLLSITDAEGFSQTLHYDIAGRLESVIDQFGRELTFQYEGNGFTRLSGFTDPDGNTVIYGYATNGNLDSVSYADGATRSYHYEDPDNARLLTGVTDENGERYVSWGYDSQGRAISNQRAGGAEHYTLTYNADGTTSVTDPLGKERTYSFVTYQGVMKVDSVAGDACAACGGEAQS